MFAFRGTAEKRESLIAEILDRDAAPGGVGSLGNGDLNDPMREGPTLSGLLCCDLSLQGNIGTAVKESAGTLSRRFGYRPSSD